MKTRIAFLRILIIALLFAREIVAIAPALAQDPITWQTSATGLRTQQNSDKETAGLGFIVQQQSWPFLSLRGGVQAAGCHTGPRLFGPIGIELGQVKIPGTTGSFASETADWSHNEMTFTNGSTQLKLTVSRLSPAILAQSTANTLRLFAGNVEGNTFDGTTVSTRPAGPSFPKYVAYSSGGTVHVQTLGTSPVTLPTLDQRWLLVWYAGNSHFVDTKAPMLYECGIPHQMAYQGDTPLLLVFQNLPTSISRPSEGGVDVSFSGGAGYMAILPLYGRNVLRAATTEGWAQAFPASVKQQASWWTSHLCSFPASVSETYSYDGASDTATIGENVSFVSVCSGGTTFAPLPPMLSIAKDALGVTFSSTIVDGNLPTEFGPSLGIENVQQYTWSVSGLKKYADSKRLVTNTGQEPAALSQELAAQVNTIVAGGHWAPWIFLDNVPRGDSRGDLYWANPADIIYHLSEIAPVVPDNLKNTWLNYIRSERNNYPPEDVYDLAIQQGTARQNYSFSGGDVGYYWRPSSACGEDCPLWAHNKRVPLYNFYSLARYYELTGDALPSTVLQKAKAALDRDMSEQDWATGYWFQGFGDFYSHPLATPNANRHLAGLMGFVKLAKLAGDSQAESLGRVLFAKAAVLRIGMAKYPRYLYSAGLVELPADPAWQVKYSAGWYHGQLFNYNWTGAYDDARQVAILDQFGTLLYEHSTFGLMDESNSWGGAGLGYAYLTAYRYMTPESAWLLTDHAKQDVEVCLNKTKALFPHWYAAFAEGMLGDEHNLNHPMDSFQTFMADAWIENAPPQSLVRSTDVPWLTGGGDLFYVQKLAETIKAYRGITWSDTPVLSLSAGYSLPTLKSGQTATYTIIIRNAGSPITNTLYMTNSVPTGLAYIPGTLMATLPTPNDDAAPTLYWSGTLSSQPAVTITYSVFVTETQTRLITTTVRMGAGAAGSWIYNTFTVLNPYAACYLPVVLRQ